MNHCTKNNEEFRGAGVSDPVAYKNLSKAGRQTAYRRSRDITNKDEEARMEMVEFMTLGGTHPSILRGLV